MIFFYNLTKIILINGTNVIVNAYEENVNVKINKKYYRYVKC